MNSELCAEMNAALQQFFAEEGLPRPLHPQYEGKISAELQGRNGGNEGITMRGTEAITEAFEASDHQNITTPTAAKAARACFR